jgi:hypothetical protein
MTQSLIKQVLIQFEHFENEWEELRAHTYDHDAFLDYIQLKIIDLRKDLDALRNLPE